MKKEIILEEIRGTYTIHSMSPEHTTPDILPGTPPDKPGSTAGMFISVTRTENEVSVVCPEHLDIEAERSDPGWKCIKVRGPLDLNLTGILHDLTGPLKSAGIPVFAISTYDTDYLLVREKNFEEALRVLSQR